MNEGSHISTSVSTVAIPGVFDFGHPSGYEVVSHVALIDTSLTMSNAINRDLPGTVVFSLVLPLFLL